jgi:protein phosphatase 1 regulatory subunit 7
MSVPPSEENTLAVESSSSPSIKKPRDSNGWDGKLRVGPKQAILANPEALSDPDYSDEDAPPVDQIEADEDLLDDYPLDTEEIDLVHCRIKSIPSLRLGRFSKAQRICLRQNQISEVVLPEELGETAQELDLYDNLIGHIRGFDHMRHLHTLDLSFNKIKHIKNVSMLKELKELYFVQNKISKIENLDSLASLRMVELAANRIREIEGLEAQAQSLEELWLGRNKIVEMKNLGHLQSLRLLDVKSNRLTTMVGLTSLANLEELYVSHNAITHISGLDQCTKLRVLDISNNKIAKLENLSSLPLLEEFWAGSNQISSFQEVERELKEKKELQTVYFEMNPLQLMGPAVYRNKIRLALPQVSQIDATFVKVS